MGIAREISHRPPTAPVQVKRREAGFGVVETFDGTRSVRRGSAGFSSCRGGSAIFTSPSLEFRQLQLEPTAAE
jgi:hypothetical protein